MAWATARYPPTAPITTSRTYTTMANGSSRMPTTLRIRPTTSMPKVGSRRSWPSRPVTNARPNECDTVSDTTSRLGRPNITSPKPSAPRVRNTPTTPATRRNDGCHGPGCRNWVWNGAPRIEDERSVRTSPPISPPSSRTSPPKARMSPEITPPGWTHDVAFDGDEVAEQLAVDVGSALDHQQMAVHALVRPDAEIAQAGGAAGNRHPNASPSPWRSAARSCDSMVVGLLRSLRATGASPARAGAMACGAGRGSWRSSGAGPSDVGDQRPESVNQLHCTGAGRIGRDPGECGARGQDRSRAPARRTAG